MNSWQLEISINNEIDSFWWLDDHDIIDVNLSMESNKEEANFIDTFFEVNLYPLVVKFIRLL